MTFRQSSESLWGYALNSGVQPTEVMITRSVEQSRHRTSGGKAADGTGCDLPGYLLNMETNSTTRALPPSRALVSMARGLSTRELWDLHGGSVFQSLGVRALRLAMSEQ